MSNIFVYTGEVFINFVIAEKKKSQDQSRFKNKKGVLLYLFS